LVNKSTMKTLTKIMNFFKTAPDKQLHFAYGDNIAFFVMCVLLLASTTLRLWEICVLGVVAAVFAGIAKEITDAWDKTNKPDLNDGIATSLGGVWAVIKILVLYFILKS
jgi:VanZ family protein